MQSFGKLVRTLNETLDSLELPKYKLSNRKLSNRRTKKKKSSKVCPPGCVKNHKCKVSRHRAFGASPYQAQVNALTGAMGPSSTAVWKNTTTTTGPAYSLGAQPLYYAPTKGVYITSADVPADIGSVDFNSFGFGKSHGIMCTCEKCSKSRPHMCGTCGGKKSKKSFGRRSRRKLSRRGRKRSARGRKRSTRGRKRSARGRKRSARGRKRSASRKFPAGRTPVPLGF